MDALFEHGRPPFWLFMLCIIGAILVISFICACIAAWWDYNRGVHSGTVIDKEYVAERIETLPVMVGNVMTMQTQVHPEKWSLLVDGMDRWSRRKEQWRSVSQEVWDQAGQGEHWIESQE